MQSFKNQIQNNKKNKISSKIISGIVFLLFISCFLSSTYSVFASRVDELKDEISERQGQIGQIEAEIKQYQKDIDTTSKEADSLGNAIKILDITGKKLNSNIYLTEKKIETTNYNIEKLGLEINTKEGDIRERKLSLAETIRNMNENESKSLIEITLGNKQLSAFFNSLEQMERFQKQINMNLEKLRKIKTDLSKEKSEEDKEKNNLVEYKGELVDQKTLVNRNKKQKSTLLAETKNKETNYKKLLEERLRQKEALEAEILAFEDQIRIYIDPKSLPPAGSGILKWPLKYASQYSCWGDERATESCITQYFGNTTFATKNPQVYSGVGHNGIDFRAPVGYRVYAPLDGVVRSVGDTDSACRGVSYGKWVLVDHGNNLTTLYAHLSLVKVVKGQRVTTGQIIAYSGNTGYSTGPHLHFSVFATPGVKVTGEDGYDKYYSKVCGTELHFPVAGKDSYLNPLSYL